MPPPVVRLTTLRTLSLAHNRLSSEALLCVTRLSQLAALDTSNCHAHLTPALAGMLAELPLRSLNVTGNKLLAVAPGNPPCWKPLFEAVAARRATMPLPPPGAEQPPHLAAWESDIAETDWEMEREVMAFF